MENSSSKQEEKPTSSCAVLLKQLIASIKSLRAAKVTTELTTSRLQQQIEQSHAQLATCFLDIHELMSLLKEVGPNTPESKYLVMLQQKRTEKLPPSLNKVWIMLIELCLFDLKVEYRE